MGFYLRKSVRVGPLRFNFSKSGIGVSTGIPGLRIGTGPRGHYIHAGQGGLYYRATLPSGSSSRPPREDVTRRPAERPSYPVAQPADATLGPAQEIESGSVLAMSDESSESLIKELNTKRARFRLAPWAAAVGLVLLFVARDSLSPVLLGIAAVVVLALVIVAWHYDALRKTVVIMYDMEQDAATTFQQLFDAAGALGRAERLGHVSTEAAVRDKKCHAGANAVITRSRTAVRTGLPPFVKCNLDVPLLPVGRQTLYFFPDRLLVLEGGQFGAVPYGDLRLERSSTRFIESDGVPGDSRVVGQTWRYVNKSGGPDRRFKDNRQIPICEYEQLHLTSASGLNEMIQSSRVGAGAALSRFLSQSTRPAFPADRRRELAR